MRTITLTALTLGSLSLVACEDPADSVPAATVVDETPATPTAETASAREALTLSPDHTTIAWVGSKVTGSHDGGFRQFSGTIDFDPAAPERSTINVTIQTDSLFSDNDDLTAHLKSGDFFGVEEFPEARFESTAIRVGGDGNATHTLTGRLTMHGRTQTISFPATVTVEPGEVRARAEFSIDRQQFGMVYPGRADDLIRDRVVIKLDLRAPRSSQPS